MVALLATQGFDLVVLLDGDQAGELGKTELLKQEMIKKQQVVQMPDALGAGYPGLNIEDVFDAATLFDVASRAFAHSLVGTTLKPNAKIDRSGVRLEQSFTTAGVPFSKTQLARGFLSDLSKGTLKLSTGESDRFEALIKKINACVLKIPSA